MISDSLSLETHQNKVVMSTRKVGILSGTTQSVPGWVGVVLLIFVALVGFLMGFIQKSVGVMSICVWAMVSTIFIGIVGKAYGGSAANGLGQITSAAPGWAYISVLGLYLVAIALGFITI